MAEYAVTVPIAGHAFVLVEADNEEEAKEKAIESVVIDDVEDWTPLEMFNEGNVCHCPFPWEIEAEEN